MESHKRLWIAVGLALFFLVFGTAGYYKIEGYSILDAIYMTVITVSTVGYGEINGLSGYGRIFTIFLILSGVGSVAFAAHAFIESMIERASNPNIKRKAMKKKIEKLQGHYIICGHGRVGAAAADHFQKQGADFVIIEYSPDEIKILEEKGYRVILGDATSEKILLDAGIKQAGALLALLNSDPDNLFTVLTARELNPTLHIIARTETASSESRILRAGADSVVSPYASAGRKVAGKILSYSASKKGIQSGSVAVEETSEWIAVTEDSDLAFHAVEAADSMIRGKILGVRRQGRDILLPPTDFQLQPGDEVLVSQFQMAHTTAIKENQPKKIVLIDDNPVIRRLYTRLFQKAGYNIMTAETGEEGLELIFREAPDAAVIDYMLPDISGLEVCKRIRENDACDTVRLFLFTADDQDETRQKAIAAGVETVVVKSPEANEIISMVKKNLG